MSSKKINIKIIYIKKMEEKEKLEGIILVIRELYIEYSMDLKIYNIVLKERYYLNGEFKIIWR